jgi:hypothetical protein
MVSSFFSLYNKMRNYIHVIDELLKIDINEMDPTQLLEIIRKYREIVKFLLLSIPSRSRPFEPL